MKNTLFTLLFLFLTQQVFGQKTVVNDFAAVDKKALQMPDSMTRTTDGIARYINANFTTESDKARAIFIWTAANLEYDVDNMFAINFYEKRADKISKVLATRKGICEHYAALFQEVCIKAGLKSYVIEGYTKQNGFADYIPHAWAAARVDGDWFFFDPTWGSGGISNKKFVRRLNNHYYKATPEAILKSHIPFDYLWQFSNYPVTNAEFYEGKVQINKAKPFYSFTDSIQLYESQSRMEQLNGEAYRVEKNGLKNALVFDRLHHIRQEMEMEKQRTTVDLYNSSVADYNAGINGLNEFINYRNKQFNPKKPDADIQAMVSDAGNKLTAAKGKIARIKDADANTTTLIKQLTKSITDVEVQLKEQQNWLQQYLSKGKAGRKSMFYKVTAFGVPLN